MPTKRAIDPDDSNPMWSQLGYSLENHAQHPYVANKWLGDIAQQQIPQQWLGQQQINPTRSIGPKFLNFPRAAVDTPSKSHPKAPKQQEEQERRHTPPVTTGKQLKEQECKMLPPEILGLNPTPPNPLDSLGHRNKRVKFGFQYPPLPSEPKMIRIIKLLPGSRTDQLQCTLEHTSIDSVEPYQALSYVWGAKEDIANILCQGESLQIPRNLYDALLQLRCHSRPKRLWADAICINQQCDAEKTLQIPLMRVIFGRAESVLIWIGLVGANLAERVFGFARRVSDMDSKNLIQDENIWHGFSVLFMQPWFWRIWCFQEVILARKAEVMWGEAKIDWEPLGQTAAWITSTGYDVMQQFPQPGAHNASLMYCMSRGVSASEPRSFVRLLMLTRQFHSTKSEDRIYGLLGIKTAETDPDQDVFFMQPSYETTKEAVYEEFAVKVIVTSQDMTLLSAVQHGPHLGRITRSWVPQWDKIYTRSIASADFLSISFSASLHLKKIPPSLHNSILVVHGLEIGSIEKVSETMSGKDRFPFEYWRIQDLWTATITLLQSYPNGQSLVVAFCWALTAGKNWLGDSVQDEASHLADFAAFVQQNFDSDIGESLDSSGILTRRSDSEKGDASRYTAAMYSCFSLRRFFVTEKGYIGIGPACMQEGDKVCLLSGAIVPFILRSDGEEHKLIGEAYVHGIMHGEACERSETGLAELSAFRLS